MPTSTSAFFRNRRVRMPRILPLLALASIVVLATFAAAAPGPEGDVYPIADRPVPARGWWEACEMADGSRAELVSESTVADGVGAGDDPVYDLVVRRIAKDGSALGSALQVNELPISPSSYRIACSPHGWLVVQWRGDNGCSLHRTISPNDAMPAPPAIAVDDDCRIRAGFAIGDDGRVVAAWPQSLPDLGSHIRARSYEADGGAGDAVVVSDLEAGWRMQPKVAVDDAGNAVVAWLGRASAAHHSEPVFARFLGSNGKPTGDVLDVSTFEYGSNADPVVDAIGRGRFEVAWTNAAQGGRVARTIVKSAEPAAATGNAAATPMMPRFGAPRFLDTFFSMSGPRGRTELTRDITAGAGQSWIVAARGRGYWRSADDTRSWTGPVHTSDESAGEVLGSDRSGTWVSLQLRGDGVWLARSTDDGLSWSEAAAMPRPQDACDECTARFGAVAAGADGAWIAAWSYADGSLAVARSTDHAKTWSKPRVVADDVAGDNGFDLDSGGDDRWVLAAAGTSLRIVRSSDGGQSWSVQTPVQDAFCVACGSAARHSRVDLATNGDGTWMVVFSSSRWKSAVNGHDGDVYSVRSDDDAATWSQPSRVHAHGKTDASPDSAPSLATDDAGNWLVAWTSHHPTGEGDGLDADIVVATSSDEGATWSAPTLLDPRMAGDVAADSDVRLAAREDGGWIAVWQRRPFVPSAGTSEEHLLVAAADATCGNASVEIGEDCDDGNTADGDGCDSSCTFTGCGNGIGTGDEVCDDGNRSDLDDCVAGCVLPHCGDGIVSPHESCDDGNTVDTDQCPATCGATAFCGDGSHWIGHEECDSGGYSTATCTPDCKLPVCGDGYLAPRVEACDDGNDVDDDACPNDCSRATCGDGLTSLGFEECDTADDAYKGVCTQDCRMITLCGDANADERVTTADARLILASAVGLPRDCPSRACDMDDNGRIAVSDAHIDLRKAVGLSVGDQCSIGTGNIVFWIDESREIGSFQIEVEYGGTGGDFEGSGGSVLCRALVPSPAMLSSFNDAEQQDILNAGFVSLEGFSGRTDLFVCRFAMPEERDGVRFVIRVVDASDTELNPITPPPLMGYRLQ